MQRRSTSRLVIDLAALAVVLGILAVRLWVYRPVNVIQDSMLPTLRPGDKLLVNTWSWRRDLPRRGTIIVMETAEKEWVVKRVVAVQGNLVELGPRGLKINGERIREPYAVRYRGDPPTRLRVPNGAVYVLGDNRPFSNDSRDFGPVKRAAIIGEAVAILAPKERRRWLPPPETIR
ncbi:MAG: signal peptidase I [Armatimonadetes bacterium]|nr:signal peptidase I [Armatimonadota bacterium]